MAASAPLAAGEPVVVYTRLLGRAAVTVRPLRHRHRVQLLDCVFVRRRYVLPNGDTQLCV